MIFKIRPLTLGREPDIEIDEARFTELKGASWRDWRYLGIEEKFAIHAIAAPEGRAAME